MNVLLYLPGLLVVLLKGVGIFGAFTNLIAILGLQLWIAMPFTLKFPRSYFTNAFNLSRQFLYKWTVNWRFIPEEDFLSSAFSRTLLLGHLLVLIAFAWRRWLIIDGGLFNALIRGLKYPMKGVSIELPSGDGKHSVYS